MKASTIFRTSALILSTVSQAVHLQDEVMSNDIVMNEFRRLETTMNEMNSNMNTISDDIN